MIIIFSVINLCNFIKKKWPFRPITAYKTEIIINVQIQYDTVHVI